MKSFIETKNFSTLKPVVSRRKVVITEYNLKGRQPGFSSHFLTIKILTVSYWEEKVKLIWSKQKNCLCLFLLLRSSIIETWPALTRCKWLGSINYSIILATDVLRLSKYSPPSNQTETPPRVELFKKITILRLETNQRPNSVKWCGQRKWFCPCC